MDHYNEPEIAELLAQKACWEWSQGNIFFICKRSQLLITHDKPQIAIEEMDDYKERYGEPDNPIFKITWASAHKAVGERDVAIETLNAIPEEGIDQNTLELKREELAECYYFRNEENDRTKAKSLLENLPATENRSLLLAKIYYYESSKEKAYETIEPYLWTSHNIREWAGRVGFLQEKPYLIKAIRKFAKSKVEAEIILSELSTREAGLTEIEGFLNQKGFPMNTRHVAMLLKNLEEAGAVRRTNLRYELTQEGKEAIS